MSGWDQIKADVESSGDVLTVTMEQLRNTHGVARLGPKVVRDISNTLLGMGLGHVPQKLPLLQNELVRLYKSGTPAGELISMVLTPGEQSDKGIVEQLGESEQDFRKTVEAIRELVAE
ncbi:MAG: hypothetical protein H0U65_00130 [Rubrobacter sp.]|nr:hypothetical protein [Rubrobacter sp.]